MIYQHQRVAIYNASQHPYRHAASDIVYSSPALPGVSTLGGTLDWMVAVLYPKTQDAVATPGDLPAVGNTLLDYRVVTDDGDGKAAAYRWEQREGDVAAQWYKIYDMDWGEESILSNFLAKTQDVYAYKYGHDDVDETGALLAGDLAGQFIYGGASAGSHLTLYANSGDGVGPATGFVQMGDNVRPLVDSTFSLGTDTYRWANIYGDTADIGTMTITGGSITDSSGAIDFGDENLSTSGTVTAGTMTIGSGSITDTSGAISFGDENLTTTGSGTFDSLVATGAASTLASGTTVGTLTLADGSITDSGGSISFGDENLSTTGTITGATVNGGNLRLSSNDLISTDTDGNINIVPDGTGVVDVQKTMTTLAQQVSGTLEMRSANRIQVNRADNAANEYGQFYWDATNGVVITTPSTTLRRIYLDAGGTAGEVLFRGNPRPWGDNLLSLGSGTLGWNGVYWSNAGTLRRVGTAEIFTIENLMRFRNSSTGANTGDALFYNAVSGEWEPSAPDTEIDHGVLNGLGDDDHSQYSLLAGRSGGQTLLGGTDANDDLTLGSTSNATKGNIVAQDTFIPGSDGDRDLGSASRNWQDLYLTGQLKSARLENFATTGALPAAGNAGRVAYLTTPRTVYVDTGSAWRAVGTPRYFLEDAANWDGSTKSVTYDVSTQGVTNAREMVWQFKDNSSNYEVMVPTISHPTATQVTITFGINLPVGTYTLVGA